MVRTDAHSLAYQTARESKRKFVFLGGISQNFVIFRNFGRKDFMTGHKFLLKNYNILQYSREFFFNTFFVVN